MKFALISTNSTHPFAPFCAFAYTSSHSKPKYQNQDQNPNPITTFCKPFTLPTILSLKSSHSKPSRLVALCASRAAKPSNAELENSRLDEEVLSEETIVEDENSQSQWNVEVGNPLFQPMLSNWAWVTKPSCYWRSLPARYEISSFSLLIVLWGLQLSIALMGFICLF